MHFSFSPFWKKKINCPNWNVWFQWIIWDGFLSINRISNYSSKPDISIWTVYFFLRKRGERKMHLTLNSMTLLSISCLSHLIVSKKFQEWPNWHVLFYSSLIITVFRHSVLSFASDNNRADTYNCIPIRVFTRFRHQFFPFYGILIY